MTVEGERRLFDLTRGGQFTLLNFGPATVVQVSPHKLRSLHVVKQPAKYDELADGQGHLSRSYGATDRTLVLIRPDGYVGAISDAGDFPAIVGIVAP